jgi:hypothetical protein
MSGYDNRDISPLRIYQTPGGKGPSIAVQPFKAGSGDYAAAVCQGKESAMWLSNQVAPILLSCLKEHELTHLKQYDQIAIQMGFPLKDGKPGTTACSAFGLPGLVVDMAAHRSMVNQMEFEAHQVHFQCHMKQMAAGLSPSDVEIVSREITSVLNNLNMLKARVEADNGVGPHQ